MLLSADARDEFNEVQALALSLSRAVQALADALSKRTGVPN